MNKFLLISIFFLVITGNAKSQERMNNEQLKANKEVALNLSKAIMAGEWGKVDNLISDDFKYEADGRPAIGKQEYIGFMKNVLSNAFTDMDMNFLHVIAEGDLITSPEDDFVIKYGSNRNDPDIRHPYFNSSGWNG